VLALTGGVGVRAVFDGGGLSTFSESAAALADGGTLVSYGGVVGKAPADVMASIAPRVSVVSPIFSEHIATRQALLDCAARLLRSWQTAGSTSRSEGDSRSPMPWLPTRN
jgi:NADPH2:quinone reductase